jgi:hypothetical protein
MHHASGRWGIVRADWVDHPAIGVDEIAVLAVLSLYASREGRCWPSQSTVAERLKRGRAWVNRVIARLVVLASIRWWVTPRSCPAPGPRGGMECRPAGPPNPPMAVTPTVSPLRHTNTSLRLNQESLPSSVQRPESQTLGVMAWDT